MENRRGLVATACITPATDAAEQEAVAALVHLREPPAIPAIPRTRRWSRLSRPRCAGRYLVVVSDWQARGPSAAI